MTPPLRRSHRMIWLALVVVLPVGFGAALYQREKPLRQEPVAPAPAAVLPVSVKSVNVPGLTLTLRRASDSTIYQLEVAVTTALEVPSALVRVKLASGWQAVGLIIAPGRYRFALPGANPHPQIEVVDDLHHHTLHSILF